MREDFYAICQELFGAVNERLHGLSSRATFNVTTPRWSTGVTRLINEAPKLWLSDGRNWRDVPLAAVDAAITHLTNQGDRLASAWWGLHTRVEIGHRFVRALPWFARSLSAPALPQAGDDYMPHVAMPNFGQSMRLVVSPGREAEGWLVTPGGESGHPLSPYFLDDTGDWLDARPAPLLPGAVRHVLTLSAH